MQKLYIPIPMKVLYGLICEIQNFTNIQFCKTNQLSHIFQPGLHVINLQCFWLGTFIYYPCMAWASYLQISLLASPVYYSKAIYIYIYM